MKTLMERFCFLKVCMTEWVVYQKNSLILNIFFVFNPITVKMFGIIVIY